MDELGKTGWFVSADGTAKLSVWGNYVTEGGFRQESDLRKKFETEDGWKFSFEKSGASWASLSGTKGDQIIYMRRYRQVV